jgi:hypothetical protein
LIQPGLLQLFLPGYQSRYTAANHGCKFRENEIMIYKLLVNAAFLAIGYYIGKEVGLSDKTPRSTDTSSASKRSSVKEKPDTGADSINKN